MSNEQLIKRKMTIVITGSPLTDDERMDNFEVEGQIDSSGSNDNLTPGSSLRHHVFTSLKVHRNHQNDNFYDKSIGYCDLFTFSKKLDSESVGH